jgi:hypothetical protein
MIRYVICIVAVSFLFLRPALAETYFFEVLPDVPVAEGVQDLPDQAVVFNKPGGRVVEAVAVVDGAQVQSLYAYYDSVLPSLGWQVKAPRLYVRGGEVLKYWVESFEGESYFHILVSPAEAE